MIPPAHVVLVEVNRALAVEYRVSARDPDDALAQALAFEDAHARAFALAAPSTGGVLQ